MRAGESSGTSPSLEQFPPFGPGLQTGPSATADELGLNTQGCNEVEMKSCIRCNWHSAWYMWASLIAQLVKNLPAMQETPV